MKAVELNRTLECDDGYFNIEWWVDRPKYKGILCEWRVLGKSKEQEGDGKVGRYWCIDCGLVVCEKHRKGHADSRQHQIRIEGNA